MPSENSLTSMILKVERAPDGTRQGSMGGSLWLQAVGPSIQERDLAHVVLTEHLHQQARQAKAEAAVRRSDVAEEVEVVADRGQLHVLLAGLGEQLLVAVLALGAGRQLDASPEQV